MSDFQRKSSMENYKGESALNVVRGNAMYKDTLKASLKDFDIPVVSSTKEQLSKKKERICEAERKRRERKANTHGPPADSMILTCSTCNRQFRARIGLVSHQTVHQRTRTYSRNNDGLIHK